MATKPKVLYLRNVPDDLVHKLRAAAALSGGHSTQKYVVQLLLEHVAELERKGQLPKGKGS
jgi:plasmid stability protein